MSAVSSINSQNIVEDSDFDELIQVREREQEERLVLLMRISAAIGLIFAVRSGRGFYKDFAKYCPNLTEKIVLGAFATIWGSIAGGLWGGGALVTGIIAWGVSDFVIKGLINHDLVYLRQLDRGLVKAAEELKKANNREFNDVQRRLVRDHMNAYGAWEHRQRMGINLPGDVPPAFPILY